MIELPPNHDYITDKLLLWNPPTEIVYYIAKIYEENFLHHGDKEFVTNRIGKMPHIAIALDRKQLLKRQVLNSIKQKMFIFYIDTEDNKAIEQLNGYKYVFVFNTFQNFYLNSNEDIIWWYQYILKLFAKNGSLIHVFLPHHIFKPTKIEENIIYDEDSIANTTDNRNYVNLHAFISHMLTFFRNVLKYPVYRFLIPPIFQHETNELLTLNKANINAVNSSNNTIQMGVMTYKNLAEAIFKMYESNNIKMKNYAISSNFTTTEHFLKKVFLNNNFSPAFKSIMDDNYIQVDNREFVNMGWQPTCREEIIRYTNEIGKIWKQNVDIK